LMLRLLNNPGTGLMAVEKADHSWLSGPV
jgi:hypothetical protein